MGPSCTRGPEDQIICDPGAEGAYLQKQAERVREAERKITESAAQANKNYCGLNGGSDDCRQEAKLAPRPGTPKSSSLCPIGQVPNNDPSNPSICMDAKAATAGTSFDKQSKKAETDTKSKKAEQKSTAERNSSEDKTQDRQVSSSEDQQASSCRDLAARAASTCESAISSIGNLKNQVGSLGSNMDGQSPASACGQMGTTANNVAGQMQGFRDSCQSAVSSCSSTCSAAVNDLSDTQTSGAYVRATSGQASCQSAASSIANMDVNINQVRSAANQANQCYQQATGSSIPSMMEESSSDYMPNENKQNALLDCNDPKTASTSPVCFCRFNSSHPSCGLNTANSNYSGNTTRPEESSASINLGGTGISLGSRNEDPDETAANPYQRSQIGLATPDAQNGSAGVGNGSAATDAGSAAGNARARAGRPASRLDSKVNSGNYTFSGGTSTKGPGAGYPEVDASQGPVRRAAGRNAKQANGTTVDLRQFLPGEKELLRRDPASQKAILGLRHTNMFSTIRSRYNRVADSLNP